MSQEEQERESGHRRTGRPSKREERYKRTTIELPESLIEFLATVQPNRTEWVIAAIREKQERESKEG